MFLTEQSCKNHRGYPRLKIIQAAFSKQPEIFLFYYHFRFYRAHFKFSPGLKVANLQF